MLLIVLYHSVVFWAGGWFSETPVTASVGLSILSKWLNSFHIYAFALVSGYLFFYLKFEKGKYVKFLPFVANKAKRLLVPYAFIAVAWVIPIQCLFFDCSVSEILYKYLLATSPSQLWFLVMLFDVFIVFWLLSDFFKKHTFIGLCVVGGFWCLGIVGGMLFPNVFMLWTAMGYVPVFWLGFKIRQLGSEFLLKIPAIVWFAVDIVLFAAVRYIASFDTFVFKALNIALSLVLHVVGATMAFVVLQKIANKVRWNNKIFNFLSKRSMTVYLIHQQIIYFTIYLLNGVINPYLNALVNFAVAMIVSLLIATLLLRFKPTRHLVGEK